MRLAPRRLLAHESLTALRPGDQDELISGIGHPVRWSGGNPGGHPMKRSHLLLWLTWPSLLSFPAFAQMGMMHGGMSHVRHQFVMMNGLDPRYARKQSPLPATADNIATGKKLYEQNCASCHGKTGIGDGEAGRSLNPRPANIAAFSKMPMASDAYLFWTIAEGGIPVGTAMPPFKNALKEDEVWKIILYLRGL
jgi:mono/diheme cytochrome c family protein